MGEMKDLQQKKNNCLAAAKALAYDMGALDRCTIHEEYVNSKGVNDGFFEEILMIWHEKDPEMLKLARGRAELMTLFEEALCCPEKCPSCAKE